MKYWWRNVVKDYLTFSARERKGLLIMVVLLAAIFLFSHFYSAKKPQINKDAFQQELINLKISVDSSHTNEGYRHEDNYADYSQPKHTDYTANYKRELFAFDPNTLTADGWKRLGVREKTANTIQNFVAKGFRFRQPEDIRKIYGLRKEEADRLLPYVHIAEKESAEKPPFANHANPSYPPNPVKENRKNQIIDINAADTSAFISLPGIGSRLAVRIVNFRQKLGGFSSVNQLAETYGVPDSTFQKIKPMLQCTNPALKKINVNTADVNELRTHPYLKWNIANAIINYRNQHGNYKSVEDLRKIEIITDDLFSKIAPYLII